MNAKSIIRWSMQCMHPSRILAALIALACFACSPDHEKTSPKQEQAFSTATRIFPGYEKAVIYDLYDRSQERERTDVWPEGEKRMALIAEKMPTNYSHNQSRNLPGEGIQIWPHLLKMSNPDEAKVGDVVTLWETNTKVTSADGKSVTLTSDYVVKPYVAPVRIDLDLINRPAKTVAGIKKLIELAQAVQNQKVSGTVITGSESIGDFWQLSRRIDEKQSQYLTVSQTSKGGDIVLTVSSWNADDWRPDRDHVPYNALDSGVDSHSIVLKENGGDLLLKKAYRSTRERKNETTLSDEMPFMDEKVMPKREDTVIADEWAGMAETIRRMEAEVWK